jgi:hypothetical protein
LAGRNWPAASAGCRGRGGRCTQSYPTLRSSDGAQQCGERMGRRGEKRWSRPLAAPPRSGRSRAGARRSDTVPVVRHTASLWCGGPGVCRAERVSPPANSRFSYFLLSVRYLTKCGYEKLQNMANSILLTVEATLHPHGRLKCWCKVICSDLSQLLDAERTKLVGSQRIVQPRARAFFGP